MLLLFYKTWGILVMEIQDTDLVVSHFRFHFLSWNQFDFCFTLLAEDAVLGKERDQWVECPITEWGRRLYLTYRMRVKRGCICLFSPKIFFSECLLSLLLIWCHLFTLWLWEFKFGKSEKKVEIWSLVLMPTW